ncbi:MAG: efflux RND transporter periplasmic adaptor subunit [Limnobacter sp.]|nr:efflux RND transporter periplasmic adaptor subunit [Limnobacter sp.]
MEIRPRVSGIVEKRLFEEGGRVHANQSLYQLDDAPYRTALSKAQADQKLAQVQVAQAKRDLSRVQPLIKSRAVSQSELEQRQLAVNAAQASLAVANAQVKDAELNVQYSQVRSPVAGFAGRSQKSEGSLVGGPQDLLTTVTQIDKVYVNFGIPQKDHDLLRQGRASGAVEFSKGSLRVEILDSAGQATGLSAALAFQDVRVNPSTGTLEARAVLDNKNERVSPGEFARVRVSGAVRKNTFLLPQRAVLTNPAGVKS